MPESTSGGSHRPERTIWASLRMTDGLGLIKFIKIHDDDQNVKKKYKLRTTEKPANSQLSAKTGSLGSYTHCLWAALSSNASERSRQCSSSAPGDTPCRTHPYIYPKTWMRMFQASFFTRKQHWCLQTVNWISKSRYIHISEHCAKIKTKGLLLQRRI